MSNALNRDATGRSSNIQRAALVVGAVFLLVGVLGFVPGVTSDFDTMQFAGHESNAKLLGIFQVSVLHNIVHLLFGVVGLLAARSAAGSYRFLLVGGLIYLALFVYGLLVDEASQANFVPMNDADDWLHLVLGLGMIALALALRPRRGVASDRSSAVA